MVKSLLFWESANGRRLVFTSCLEWLGFVFLFFFNTCVFKLRFSEIEEACFNKSRVRGVCRHGVHSGFRLAISSPMVPGKQCVMFWMRTSRLALSAHGLKGFIVFWQRGRWQRSVPVNNVPILWRFSASPEICRVLKKIVYPEGWSACDTVFCPLVLHSWVTGGGGVGWVYPSCPCVKFRWISRQFIAGLTHRQFTGPCSPLVRGTLFEPATFLPWRKKMLL